MVNQPAGNTAVNRIQNFITGTDQSKAAFESVGSSLRKLTGNITSLRGRLRDLTVIGGGIAAIFRSLGNAAQTASKAIVDMELAERRLEFTLKKTGQFTAETKRSFLDLAESLQFTTRFTAGTVIEMEQLLLSMGQLSTEQVPETIETLLSYIDVYRGGQGAIEITRQFARAIGGAGGDVGEMGIVIDTTATTTEKWNQAMTQLRAKFGEAAFFLANTASGKFTIFQNIIGQMTINMGQAIIRTRSFQNAIAAVVQTIKDFGLASVGVDKISDVMIEFADSIIDPVVTALLSFADLLTIIIPVAIDILISILQIFIGTLFTVGKTINDMMEPGAGFREMLIGMGVASEDTANAIQTLGARLEGLGERLGGGELVGLGPQGEVAEQAAEKVQEFGVATEQVFSKLGEFISKLAENFFDLQDNTEGARAEFDDMNIEASEFTKKLNEQERTLVENKAAIQQYQEATNRFFVEAFDRSVSLEEAYDNLGDALRDAFITDASQLATSALFSRQVEVRSGLGQLVGFEEQLGPIGAAVDLITSPFKALGDTIAESVGQAQLLGDTGQTVAGSLKSAFDPLGQVLGAMFEVPLSILGTLFDATIGFLIKLLGQALASIFGIEIASAAAKTGETAAALAQITVITTAASAAAAALTAAWAPAATLAAIATLGGALAAGAAVPGIITANLAAVSAITAGSGVVSGATGAVPGLQEGGLVTRPTLAVIGEGPSDELVLPLDNPQVQALLEGGRRSLTLNLNIASLAVNDRQQVNRIADEVARRVGAELRDATGFGTVGGLRRGS